MFLFISAVDDGKNLSNLFKYISCSYLSNGKWVEGNLITKFKYISCSYLSAMRILHLFLQRYLNTSHVLIYLCLPMPLTDLYIFKYISCSYLSLIGNMPEIRISNLNTSHVLIYRS